MYLSNHIFKDFIFNVTTETYLKICMCLSFFNFMGFNLYEAFTMINMINLSCKAQQGFNFTHEII